MTKRSSRNAKGARPILVKWEEMAKDLGIKTYDQFDFDTSEVYGHAHREALKEAEGYDMDESAAEAFAEEKALEAEGEYSESLFKAYMSALEEAVERTFEPANLDVSFSDWTFRLSPKKSWEDSAKQIIEVINGVGYFHFSTLREFLDSGPYTAREAVEKHLHWMKSYGDVYGDPSPARIFEKSFEHATRYL